MVKDISEGMWLPVNVTCLPTQLDSSKRGAVQLADGFEPGCIAADRACSLEIIILGISFSCGWIYLREEGKEVCEGRRQ